MARPPITSEPFNFLFLSSSPLPCGPRVGNCTLLTGALAKPNTTFIYANLDLFPTDIHAVSKLKCLLRAVREPGGVVDFAEFARFLRTISAFVGTFAHATFFVRRQFHSGTWAVRSSDKIDFRTEDRRNAPIGRPRDRV